MQILTIGLVISVIKLTICLKIPAKVAQTNFHVDIIPAGSEYTEDPLFPFAQSDVKPAKNFTEQAIAEVHKPINVGAKKKTPKENGDSTEAIADIENDYSFLPDKMPDLPEDEYEVNENSTPLEFLKKQEDGVTTLNIPPHILTAVSRHPIFITVPIYINVGGGLTLHLQMDSTQLGKLLEHRQTSQLTQPIQSNQPMQRLESIGATDLKELSPTSQFNRLLRNYNDIPTQQQQLKPKRATKRKRKKSSSRTTAAPRSFSYQFYF